MTRFILKERVPTCGRLISIRRRPIENIRQALLRLEFELFAELPDSVLESTGKVASRDLVVGDGSVPAIDSGLKPYVEALRIVQPEKLDQWLRIAPNTRWVSIVFGPIANTTDLRNPFDSILPFDAREYFVKEYPYDLHNGWVKVKEAAIKLKCSISTVHRVIEQHEGEFGAWLVRRTTGGHRRINLALLRNLR